MGNVRDRVEGILIGLAAGDRNGGPIRMAVRLAESLADRRQVDVDDIGTRYLDWWHEGAFDAGPTAARVFALVDSGLSFYEAAQQVHVETGEQTAGCNPAHRSAPLAMMPDLNVQELADYARKEAMLTHHRPLSGEVAAAVAVICHELVRGGTWPDAVESARAGRRPETQAAMTNLGPDSLNSGGFAPDVLAAAVHFVGSSDTFDAALDASLRFAGPANYCPVLVGSMGGARWGASSIGDRMLKHCDILPRVRLAATNLALRWVEEP
jgi:ADP-ribosylglycohydrolase